MKLQGVTALALLLALAGCVGLPARPATAPTAGAPVSARPQFYEFYSPF